MSTWTAGTSMLSIHADGIDIRRRASAAARRRQPPARRDKSLAGSAGSPSDAKQDGERGSRVFLLPVIHQPPDAGKWYFLPLFHVKHFRNRKRKGKFFKNLFTKCST